MRVKIEILSMDKLISIIMPCYRAEAYIGNILNDVISQTYKDWELLVISNGAWQEKQLDIISGFAQKDDRIRLMTTEMGETVRKL